MGPKFNHISILWIKLNQIRTSWIKLDKINSNWLILCSSLLHIWILQSWYMYSVFKWMKWKIYECDSKKFLTQLCKVNLLRFTILCWLQRYLFKSEAFIFMATCLPPYLFTLHCTQWCRKVKNFGGASSSWWG
jgi:hypothetical protein